MKKIIIILISLAMSAPSFAQQEPHYTQGQFNNMLLLNPAYAGTGPSTRIGARYRNQWSGFAGAPRNLNLIADGLVKDKLGLGGAIYSDQIGIEKNMGFEANANYHIDFKDPTEDDFSKLSIGLKAGMQMLRPDFTKLSNVMAGDPLYAPSVYNKTDYTYLGLGALYYSQKFYLGVASPRAFGMEKSGGRTKIVKPHFYGYSGYTFFLDQDQTLDLTPSVLLKYQAQAPLEADLAMNLWYKNTLGVGAGYRTGDAFNIMAQYKHKSGFIMGYSHDITTSKLRSQSFGSSEVFVGFKFSPSQAAPSSRMRTPRM